MQAWERIAERLMLYNLWINKENRIFAAHSYRIKDQPKYEKIYNDCGIGADGSNADDGRTRDP